MDQNTEKTNFEIQIPEPPTDPSPKKKGSKIALIVILSSLAALLIAAAVISVVLFKPILTDNHFENTFKTVFFDPTELNAFTEAIASGVKSEFSVALDPSITGAAGTLQLDMVIARELSEENEKGSLKFSLGAGKKSVALSLVYDKDLIALGVCELSDGVVKGTPNYISISRTTPAADFSTSIFSPESGSEYALDKEIFDQIYSILETFENVDRDIDKESLNRSFENIKTKVAEQIKIENSFRFADSSFSLMRESSFTLDSDAIRAMIDALVSEIETNPDFAALFDYSSIAPSEGEEKADAAKLLKELRDEVKDLSVEVSWLVGEGYLRYVKLTSDSTENTSDCFEIRLDFVYNQNVAQCTLDFIPQEGDVVTIAYSKVINGDEINATVDLNSAEGRFETKLKYDKKNGDLQISAGIPGDLETGFDLRGNYRYTPEQKKVNIVFDSLSIGKEIALSGFALDIEIGKNEEKIIIPESKSLADIDNGDINELIYNLPKDTAIEIFELITGREYESFLTADGVFLFDATPYNEAIQSYATLYMQYINRKEQIIADAVYVYVPELGINILYNYNSYTNMVYYKLAFNMTEDLLKDYHPTFFDEKGNMIVHVIDLTSTTAPTCTSSGISVYTCSICGDFRRESINATGHAYEDFSKPALCDNGEALTIRYRKCKRCDFIEALAVGQGVEVNYMFRMEHQLGGHRLQQITNSSLDGICRYFGLPEEIEELLNIVAISNIEISPKAVVRLPIGITSLKAETFSHSNNVQVLILHSNLKNIEEGAFSSYESLHTIFFRGTEEQWKTVEFPDLEKLNQTVKVVYCPDGVSPDKISQVLIDPAKMTESFETVKNAFTADSASAQKLGKLSGVSTIHKGSFAGIAYDAEKNCVAVLSQYKDGVTPITVYDLSTKKQIASANLKGKVNVFDMSGGYFAYGLEGSAKILYIYSIANGEVKELEVPLYTEFKKDELAFVFIDGEKVFTMSSEQHVNLVYYSLTEQKFIKSVQTYAGYLIIDPERHRIIRYGDGYTASIQIVDTLTGKAFPEINITDYKVLNIRNGYIESDIICYDWSGNVIAPEACIDPYPASLDYRNVAKLPIFETSKGFAAVIVTPECETKIILKDLSSDKTKYLDGYADSALITSDGNFLIYIKDADGLYLVDMN